MSGAHQRRHARKPVSHALMISNGMTGETLGRVGNLSADGMMLITSRPMHEGWYYQVGFSLQVGAVPPRRLDVGIQCLWTEAARTAGTYWTGCKIIDIAPEEQQILLRWIEQQGEAEAAHGA
ncbi:MAG: PilZ domain-containing protein [Xanthomonadales bacterium]|nr:PilZ domain-containing protein [Xanthomonadales bacterium]